jgi:uncharacterized membrane protein YeaQ/YmgE (transglycosylase-associated protein family)
MNIVAWILLGLVAGAVAKIIMPGDDPGGCIITILLGVAGAFVGGFIGQQLGWGPADGFNFHSLGVAIVGAVVLLLGYRLILKRK